jgi:hypothetical protein
MSTVFLDEIETNAVVAALIERRGRLTAAVRRLEGQSATDDRDFALACNRQAVRHTELALHRISGSLPDVAADDGLFDPAEGSPDPIDDYKAARDRGLGYHDFQAEERLTEADLFRGYGNPEGDPTLNGAFR